jgi:antitoxin (DNA-binding transcriptional repressor) of toxin-antitoxin stability system
MRNHSGGLLRELGSGESVLVTSRGRSAALVVPPAADTLTALIASGQACPAVAARSTLRAIHRTQGRYTTKILADQCGER